MESFIRSIIINEKDEEWEEYDVMYKYNWDIIGTKFLETLDILYQLDHYSH